MVTERNLVEYLIEFEGGGLELTETIELFSHLVSTGNAWTLQGVYGRTAARLIELGYLNEQGLINYEKLDEYYQNL